MLKFLILSVAACAFAANIPEDGPAFDARIVGGHNTTIRDYPWQVSLVKTLALCGGSVISQDWLLSAAHCFEDQVAEGWIARVGSSYLLSGGSEHAIAKAIIHPKYDHVSQDNDVAVLRVARPIEINGITIRAVKLIPPGMETPVGTLLRVSGFGLLQEAGKASNLLQALDVPVIEYKVCDRFYAEYGGLTSSMFCAGYEKGGKDACQGDSGGPIVNKEGHLVGIVSWGIGCARPGLPGVYTNMSKTDIRNFVRLHTNI